MPRSEPPSQITKKNFKSVLWRWRSWEGLWKLLLVLRLTAMLWNVSIKWRKWCVSALQSHLVDPTTGSWPPALTACSCSPTTKKTAFRCSTCLVSMSRSGRSLTLLMSWWRWWRPLSLLLQVELQPWPPLIWTPSGNKLHASSFHCRPGSSTIPAKVRGSLVKLGDLFPHQTISENKAEFPNDNLIYKG